MLWFSYKKIELLDKLDINKYHEELIKLYHKYFILLNGYDKMDSFLKVTNDDINKYLDKDIYEYATNYKEAVDFVNKLNNKNQYLGIYKNQELTGIVRFNKNAKSLKIYELISNSEVYNDIIKYLEQYALNNNIKKIYLEIPINDIKLLVLSSKLGYVEDDINNSKKYIVNKEL